MVNMDNIIKIDRSTGKVPTKAIDAMSEVCNEYIILGINKKGEFCYTVNAESHGSAFQMLIIVGGSIYKDQFNAP